MKKHIRLAAFVSAVSAGLGLACDETDPDGLGGERGTPSSAGVETLKGALPSSVQMAIRVPTNDALSPEIATFYSFTRDVTTHVNGFVWVVTNIIEEVTEEEPTATDGETWAVWGPHTEPLGMATWRVRVDRVADGTFDYVVEGWPRAESDEAALSVLVGTHRDGENEGEGQGTWSFDLSAAHELDPIANDATGTVSIAYEVGDARALEVNLDEVIGRDDPNAVTALYRYTEAALRSGSFDFISNMDINADEDPNLNRRELLQVRTRWLETGAGRADVVATHGDLPQGTQVDLVECWNAAFMQTFVSYEFADATESDGDPGECAFADRETPQFEGFDADAFADGDFVAALPDPGELDPESIRVDDPVAEPAAYYLLARDIIDGLDEHVGGVVGLIHDITRQPPNDCDPERCIWGPYSDWDSGITHLLLVHRVADAEQPTFTYALMAKHFGDDAESWASLIEGGFVDTGDDTGQGFFVYDLTAASSFEPDSQTTGSFRAEYARTDDGGGLNVRVDQLSDEGQPAYDARYYLLWDEGGAGRLDMEFPADVDDGHDGRDAIETLAARIRWIHGGAGIATVTVSGGDYGEAECAHAVECWDEHASRTHVDAAIQACDDEARPNPDADACVSDEWEDPALPPLGDEENADG